ncbi:hypothetical protein N656DRAFT_141697 [Canariomyces notabilis]|uniref:Uncharacterized protein n=1 Tax=Canariomyces notabilis TaxID=2074819 RepID=A0AAN6TC06_9PEZI|nr:hypothetical protein N656DRAFT_141697 [Canariomyces arenarius]
MIPHLSSAQIHRCRLVHLHSEQAGIRPSGHLSHGYQCSVTYWYTSAILCVCLESQKAANRNDVGAVRYRRQTQSILCLLQVVMAECLLLYFDQHQLPFPGRRRARLCNRCKQLALARRVCHSKLPSSGVAKSPNDILLRLPLSPVYGIAGIELPGALGVTREAIQINPVHKLRPYR